MATTLPTKPAAGANWATYGAALDTVIRELQAAVATLVGSDTTAPTVPSNVTASNVTASGFSLSWTASTDAVGVVGYDVQIDGSSYATPATNSATVTGRSASTAYSVRVRAQDAAGNYSALSTAVSVTTSASSDTTAPTVPTNVAASNISATGFTLTWTASTDAVGVTGYDVQRDGTSVATPTGTSTSLTGLTAGTSYSMRVRARDAAGNYSALSTAVSVTTTAAGSVTHGFQILATNTGHDSYTDPTLGRKVTDADLTVHTGLVSLSDFVADNGTITRHWFKGGLIFDRNNVTLTACKFDGSVSGYYAGVHHPFTLNWCTVDTPGAAQDDGIHFQDYTAYRCRIGGGSDGAKINGGCTLTECYIRTEAQDASDHNDGLQAVGSYTGNTVQRCNIDCRPIGGSGGPNAAIMVADSSTGLHKWYDNFVAGGGYTLRCYDGTTYDVQGNWVLDQSWQYGPADRQVIPQTNLTWGTVRQNLIVSSAGVQVSVLATP